MLLQVALLFSFDVLTCISFCVQEVSATALLWLLDISDIDFLCQIRLQVEVSAISGCTLLTLDVSDMVCPFKSLYRTR